MTCSLYYCDAKGSSSANVLYYSVIEGIFWLVKWL